MGHPVEMLDRGGVGARVSRGAAARRMDDLLAHSLLVVAAPAMASSCAASCGR
jgi:hypothetical protein